MRKFLGTRIGVIAATSIIAVLAIGMVAQAALNLNKPLPATGNIKAAVANLSFSSVSTMMVPITSVSFGDVDQGTTKNVTVYFRNDGAYTLNSLAASVTGLDDAVATINVGAFSATTLAPGAIGSVSFTLVPVDNGPTGPITPTITFSATN